MSAKPILAILRLLVLTPMVVIYANVYLVTVEMDLTALIMMNVPKDLAIGVQIATTQRDLISAAAKQDFLDQVLTVKTLMSANQIPVILMQLVLTHMDHFSVIVIVDSKETDTIAKTLMNASLNHATQMLSAKMK
jgi:hypothetical protein